MPCTATSAVDGAAPAVAVGPFVIRREWVHGVLKCRLALNDAPLSVVEVLRGLAAARPAGDDVGTTLARAIATAPYAALFFETPPVTMATLAWPFECVLIDAPQLAAMRPEPTAFADRFDAATGGIAVFESLGGDAVLVSPVPAAPIAVGAHLADVLRHGDPAMVAALWRAVGSEMLRRIGGRPLWLSTSGVGVAWLHMRIDTRPKYYVHAPYRAM